MLKTYKTCNPMVRFLKYEFNNKLLGGVTLLRVILGVTQGRNQDSNLGRPKLKTKKNL